MITASLVGDRALIERMGRLPGAVKRDLDRTVMALGFELEAYVKARKLTGQVLHVRTGRLRASIGQSTAQQAGDSRSRFVSSEHQAIYYVGTNVKYGAAWEFGSRAHEIVARRGKALRFTIGGEVLYRRKVNIPAQAPRAFLKPSLDENRAHITSTIQAAAQASIARNIKAK